MLYNYFKVICKHACLSIMITDQERELINQLTVERFSIMWTEEHRITSVNQLQVKYNEKRKSIQGKVHRGCGNPSLGSQDL